MFPPQVAVIDFEACGFGPGTWPIEVGWIRAGDQSPRSMTIRPHPKFNLDLWQPGSQKIHKLTLPEIQRDGMEAVDVLAAMRRDLAGCIVISDAPSFDQSWLNTLALACDQAPPFQIADLIAVFNLFHKITGATVRDMLNEFRLSMERSGPAPHRAGDDVFQVMSALRAAFSAATKTFSP